MVVWKEAKQIDSYDDPERTHDFPNAASRNVVEYKICPDRAVIKVCSSIAYIRSKSCHNRLLPRHFMEYNRENGD